MRFVWEKLGLTLSPQSFDDGLLRPWMRSHAQGPSALLLDDRVRIYFSCRPTPDSDGQYVSYSAFVDVDRRDPTQILRVAERLGYGIVGANAGAVENFAQLTR